MINKVLKDKPKHAAHWTVWSASDETGIAKSAVRRFFKLFGLQPHRSKALKLSTDPFFVENDARHRRVIFESDRLGAGAMCG